MPDPRLDVTIPSFHALVGEAVLAVWDNAVFVRSSAITPRVNGKALPRPHACLVLPTTWGGSRTVVAFRWPVAQRGGALGLSEAAGPFAETPRIQNFDAAALAAGLTPTAQAQLISTLLDFCRTAFARRQEKRFSAVALALLAEIFPEPAAIVPAMEAVPGLVLAEGALPAAAGEVARVLVVDRQQVRPQRTLPLLHPGRAKAGQAPMHLMLDGATEGARIVLIGRDGGMACRVVRGAAPRLRLLEWLERGKVTAGLREYVAAGLAASDRPMAAAMLEDMQLLAPLPRRPIFAKGRPLGADIDLAIHHRAGGLFVAGWLRDPHAMVTRIEAVSPLGTRRPLDVPLFRFPRPDVAEQFGERGGADRSGFVAYLSDGDSGPICHQHRFELHLRSGATLDVVPALPPLGLSQARDAVLGALPPAFATERALAECIAPAAAHLHAAYMATRREPERVNFGTAPARPVVSIVVPLYRVLDFLRFQIAAFAIDPMISQVELIYVLDSPEQREEVEHLLLGLHALYGVPMTLLVQSGNYGFSSACNTGGRAARAPATLFLNSDVIPDRPGWLAPMAAELTSPRVGAVGPKLLFDDQSLQHAGMFFQRDLKGAWLNQHYFKGMPRDFAPACHARSVPAVTGAAVLMPTELFQRIGGFSEDYIIGDYEDSDLCLKVRAAGYDIRYQPEAELFHLERRSISRHTGYMRGIACAYNRRLHSGRWAEFMELLCPGGHAAFPCNDDFPPLAGAAE